jgi:4-hydroxy-tetrahydrodipicolinate synthase
MADDLRDGLRGVAVGLLTPFDEASDVAHDLLAENARDLYDEGIRTFLACANISEYHSLTHGERRRSVATVTDALPDDATVLAGVGGSTRTAADLIESAGDAGADGAMVMPPDHTYVHERGLLTYYRRLAEHAADAGLGLVPYVRGFDPSVEFLVELTGVENMVGVKYALEDALKLRQAVVAGDDDVVWVDGAAEPYAVSFWEEGAEGFTAGVSNFEPRLGLALFDALEAGDFERARELRDVALPFQSLRGESGSDGGRYPAAISVPAVKRGLELAGYHAGGVREPIRPLSEADRERATELYEAIQADLDRLL